MCPQFESGSGHQTITFHLTILPTMEGSSYIKPVKLGVIGYGVIGRVHCGVAMASSLADVVAVADLLEDNREAARNQGVPRVYDSGDSLIDEDPEVEAVLLALPTCYRTDLALHAFACGKHVLTEKPVAMNAGEVRQMIAARGDLVGACCSARNRFLESAQTATDFAASGALGELRLVRCRAVEAAGPQPEKPGSAWRLTKSLNGGGILVNWGSYDLDYLLGITGWSLRPQLVLAQTWPVPPQFASHIAPGSDGETHVAALIRCEGGTVITLERGEFMPAPTDEAWQIIGTKGSLSLMMNPGKDKRIVHYDTSTEEGVIPKVLWEGDEDGAVIHARPLQDFAEAIVEQHPPKTGLEQSLIIQQITDAIYASADRGEAVEIA